MGSRLAAGVISLTAAASRSFNCRCATPTEVATGATPNSAASSTASAQRCAGIGPSPLIGGLDLPTDERGYLLCERDLRVRGRDDVWAIGDAARNPDPEGQPYPATAQHAVRQAAHLATSIARVLSGREPERFVFRSRGVLAALGCRTGVARVLGVSR